MSSFLPLNIEIEEESEDEVDDSKEILIEEALKLYQNALKLHSQGPQYYDAAENAYNELFRSEIFTWEESLSEAQAIERYNEASDDDFEDSLPPALAAPLIAADGMPSSLPQILYLAYKNRGQFLLDQLKDHLSRIEHEIRSGDALSYVHTSLDVASSSLRSFVEALDRDETDLELWRLISRIGGYLGSVRVARFCLEAVLDSDEGSFDAFTEPFGLEVGFAKEQLKPILQVLDDQLSQTQNAKSLGKHETIIKSFKRKIDPCPYLPTSRPCPGGNSVRAKAVPHVIKVPLRSYASCGKAIMLQLSREAQGLDLPDPGATYSLALPIQGLDEVLGLATKRLENGDTSSNMELPLNMSAHEDIRGNNAQNLEKYVSNLPATEVASEPLEVSPTVMHQITPGVVLDNSRTVDAPTTAEAKVVEVNEAAKQIELAHSNGVPVISTSLPTRKRSSDMAELPDSSEIGRSRSKRIKAKGSLDLDVLNDSTAEDWARWYEQQLEIYHHADREAFTTIDAALLKLKSEAPISSQALKEIVSNTSPNGGPNGALHPIYLIAQDLKSTLDTWDSGRSKAFLHGHDSKDPAGGIGAGRDPSFAAFLETSNQDSRRASKSTPLLGETDDHGIEKFVDHIQEKEWISAHQLAYRWLEQLLVTPIGDHMQREHAGWYETYLWPEILKESVVQMLVYQDQAITSELNRLVKQIEQCDARANDHSGKIFAQDIRALSTTEIDEARRRFINLAQSIFELHLDVYERITNPRSKVDEATRILQRDRVGRWAAIASKLINQWSWSDESNDELSKTRRNLHVRFIWASVVCNSLLEPNTRDNTILCYQDLIHMLHAIDSETPSRAPFVIELPNNGVMPEISVQAAQREVSRLTTMDFFMGVFNPDNTDPLTTIESLEPLLDLSVKQHKLLPFRDPGVIAEERTLEDSSSTPASQALVEASVDPKLWEALSFFNDGTVSLRLFLWQKLRDAYRAIAYPPQVLSCDLRMIALIVDHLKSSAYTERSQETRRDEILRWLHRIDDHVTRALSIALTKADAFDCLEADHACTSLEVVTFLQRLLHIFALWEDTIRVGKTPPPVQINQHATRGLAKSTDKFRDMIVKTCTLQYTLLKEVLSQNCDFFEPTPLELIKHLENVHQALGLRCYCSLADKTFIKLMKKDLEAFKLTGGWEVDMSQLMYDLYGVKISSSTTEMQDHGCITESLDRNTALEMMDLVMTQVERISIKDLLKSDLKFTVDRMQQVIMIPKIAHSTARTFNNRLNNNYLKSPLNPYNMYRALRGIGGLCGIPAHDNGSDIALRGWYFLLGQIALTKFRSMKRSSAGSTDDLNISKAFLRHDLEFDTDRWETWYRLGQVYDAMVEEDTTWTADKLDNHMDELADLQRKALHCYTMAIAVATRCAEGSFEDTSKMADLCAEFGTRVYASTREPFSMKAFSLDEFNRHYNSRAVGMYKGQPFRSMELYAAWKFASILLRRASVQKPQNWVTSYNLGKVLWKMHNCSDEIRGPAKRIGYQPAIDAFIRAIEACPEKRDNRHPDKDPIIEPHYKLLSIVHKLVRSRRVSSEEGRQILQATPYARKAPDFQGDEGWNGYVWQILKALRAADKANWHHRMVARAAHIMYDDEPNDPRSAVGARNELSQQIFTKTMAIQVWKPDNERPGRHFIYTGRYVRFFTRLLYQLNDKASLEALARRIRKRASDFVSHGSVWEEVCRAYLKLLHHQPYCIVTDGYSETVFQGMDPESFQLHAARLEAHVHSQQASPPYLDILREAIELKKLNNNLFRPINLFEDLIRDVYAHLYSSIIPGLIKNDAVEENRVRMRVDNILSNPTPSMIETPPPELMIGQGGEQPKKSGARYVTGREIVRKAEAIAAKPAPTVPVKVLKTLAPAPASELDGRPPSDIPRFAVVINNDGTNEVVSSVPGSVHDSADDESELSEVDDEVANIEPEAKEDAPERSLLFPNLLSESAEKVEEIGEETNDERADGDEDERIEEEADAASARDGQEVEAEAQDDVVKERGVHEGSW